MTVPVILVEAKPRRATDGAVVSVLLAGGGAEQPYTYRGDHWRAGVAALPTSTAALDFDGLQLGGGGIPDALRVDWAPVGNAPLAELAALYWGDAPVRVWIGPEGPQMPPLEADGLVLDAPIEAGALRIGMADVAVDLKRAILVDRFKGTGGLEGPIDWEGQLRTRAWGRCWNVPGKLLDRASNVWCFGDPARAWRAFDAIRDKGVPADVAALTTLDWQGSAEATFAALKAAPAIAGGGVRCPSIACVKWWGETAGDLHADIRGEIEGGYVETAPEIVARVVAVRSALAFAAGELDGAIAARPQPFGYRVAAEATTAAQAVSDMLTDVGMSWVLVAGEITFRPWEWSAPVRRAASVGVTRRELVKPVGTRKLGYRRNQAPMARGDLGDFVLATDVVFDDGSTAADLSAQLKRITGDDWLSRNEKPALVREWGAMTALLDATEAQWVAIGSPADAGDERAAARAAVDALRQLLAGLVPAWDDAATDTPIDGDAFNDAWLDARAKVELFAAAIRGRPGRDGTDGKDGIGGKDGRDGSDGRTPVFHFAWANSSDGRTDFTIGAQAGRVYQGVYVDYTAGQDSSDPAAYIWSRYTGQDGKDGADGIDGADGTKIHKAYANSPNGHVDFSVTDYVGRRYLGLRIDYVVPDSTNPDDYAWSLIQGADGSDGADGADGLDGFVVDTDTPFFAIPVFPSGAAKPSWTGGSGTIRLRKGSTLVDTGVTYALESLTNVAGSTLDGSRFSFAGITADTGSFVIAASYAGQTYRARVDAKKVYDGSAAFKGSTAISGRDSYAGAVSVGSGSTPIPGGSTVVLSVSIDYSAPEYGFQSGRFTGRVSLYYRNATDNGERVFLGTRDGSTASRVNRGTDTEPEFEDQPGTVSAAFSFASAAADKIYEYEARFGSVEGGPGQVTIGGEIRAEVSG